MKFDLHMHSYYSDGRLSPADLMQKCKECGLEAVSLTDHENVGGISEAKEAAGKLGIKTISGIEFTSDFQGQEHHILGYFIDCQNTKLKEFLETWKESKMIQVKKMIEKLRQFGFEVSLEEVMAQVRGSVDRYHIALAIFPGFEESAEEKEKQRAFFRKYLLEKSAGGEELAFVARDRPGIQSVINAIHDSGGLAFWAHPSWRIKEAAAIQELAVAFKKMGLDGIEVLYSLHKQEQTLLLHKIAQNLSMYESGGSDFHKEDISIRQVANFQTFGVDVNFPFNL